MAPPFSFEILAKDKKTRARAGIINTLHGQIKTPYLVPVATRGFLIAISHSDLNKINPQALLANTYHLHFRSPGDKKIRAEGGLHKFMSFNKTIFTDSGGFQALSLGPGLQNIMRKIGFLPKNNLVSSDSSIETFAKLTNKGILFKSVYNNKEEFMGAKESMKIQENLGSDIIFAFDQCNPQNQTLKETEKSMNISHKWEIQSLKYRNKEQAIYGIIHGGVFKSLRKRSTKFISSLPFDGIAVGGSIGKNKKEMYEILKTIINAISEEAYNKPRHMLGIGWIDDLFECVSLGIDTFDCVQTTRVARHGYLYVSPESGGNKSDGFKIRIGRATYAKDEKPIDSSCTCQTCKKHSRSHLHKLFKSKDLEYSRLATIHNLFFIESLMKNIRNSILKGNFNKLKKRWMK